MKVFISWSGNTSRELASALRDWIPMVLQAAKPYMSARDNEAGVRWSDVVSGQLESSDYGLICLTPTNIESRWINFEAGALSKSLDRARVVPLLYGLQEADVPPPLSTFMMKTVSQEGVYETVASINSVLDPDRRVEDGALISLLDALWPILEQRILNIDAKPEGTARGSAQRPDREILEEILRTVRSSAQGERELSLLPNVSERWTKEMALNELQILAGPEGHIEQGGNEIHVRMPNLDITPEKTKTFNYLRNVLGLLGYDVRMN